MHQWNCPMIHAYHVFWIQSIVTYSLQLQLHLLIVYQVILVSLRAPVLHEFPLHFANLVYYVRLNLLRL